MSNGNRKFDPPTAPDIEVTESPNGYRARFTSATSQIAPVRHLIEQRCAVLGFDEPACGEIGLCINEAIANIIRHAYSNHHNRPIEITSEFDGARLTIGIRDWGNGVNPSKLPPSPASQDPLKPGGLGLICMRELMDGAMFTPQPDGMLLTLYRYRDRSKATELRNRRDGCPYQPDSESRSTRKE